MGKRNRVAVSFWIIIVAALVLVAFAGCGGSSKTMAQQAEVSGSTLTFPDGSSIRISVSGSLPAACPTDLPAGAMTNDGSCIDADGCDVQTFSVGDLEALTQPSPGDPDNLELDLSVRPVE